MGSLQIAKDERVALKPFDRVVMGGELLLFHKPDEDPATEPPDASSAIEEYQACLADAAGEKDRQFQQQMAEFEEQKKKWFEGAQEQKETEDQIALAEHERAMAAVDREILEVRASEQSEHKGAGH